MFIRMTVPQLFSFLARFLDRRSPSVAIFPIFCSRYARAVTISFQSPRGFRSSHRPSSTRSIPRKNPNRNANRFNGTCI